MPPQPAVVPPKMSQIAPGGSFRGSFAGSLASMPTTTGYTPYTTV